MAKAPTIVLTYKSSAWVKVESGNALPATYAFVTASAKHMDRVCFGDSGIANVGSLALKLARIPAFIAHARKNGMAVVWNRNGTFVEAV